MLFTIIFVLFHTLYLHDISVKPFQKFLRVPLLVWLFLILLLLCQLHNLYFPMELSFLILIHFILKYILNIIINLQSAE